MRGFYFVNIYKMFGKIWGVLTVALLAALLTAQLWLTMPSSRAVMATIDDFEPVSGGTVNSLELGEITLRLVGIRPSGDIVLLQNGQPIAFFDQESITVTVSNNALLEVYTLPIKQSFKVAIESYSPNITLTNKENIVDVNSSITILTRVFVDR